MVVSEVLGLQGGKVTISSLEEQSDSLFILQPLISVTGGVLATETEQSNIKKPKKNPCFWKYFLSDKNKASILLLNSKHTVFFYLFQCLVGLYMQSVTISQQPFHL